ncbi:MAG: hypothetical protein ABJE95_02090 [Byssovorax sp.]
MLRVAAFAHGALVRGAVFVATVALAACAAAPLPPARVELAAAPGPGLGAEPTARFFHALPEAGFWVTHDAELDRVVVSGARLELAPSGQILRAAWQDDALGRADGLVGSIAVPGDQGGGFVHWTKSRVFRSSTFTGPIALVSAVGDGLRGVRPGLAGLVVIADTGPGLLVGGGASVGALADPGVLDRLAASATRAIQLDVFGRPSATFDGGRSWLDLTAAVGIGVRSISAEDGELGVETWQGRFVVGPGGALAPAEAARRNATGKAFQIAWKGTRAERDDALFGYREMSSFQAAVLSGAAVGDGTAFGVAQGAIARVELATGHIVNIVPEGFEAGLACEALGAGRDVLFVCAWDRYQGRGGYVLRSRGGALPVIERAFADEGAFLADDDGALAFTGSCSAKPRFYDADEAGRGGPSAEPRLGPILCVRRAPQREGDPAEWIERAVEIPAGASLAAWIPRRDGGAVALVAPGDALPDPAGAPRARDEGGVRVIRVDREIEGFRWSGSSWGAGGNSRARIVDKALRARADGSIDAWMVPTREGALPVWLGVTLAADGTASTHPLPPDVGAMQVTGAFGVAVARRGDLFETLDHGVTWRAAGPSPLPPEAASTGGCSALGCVLGPVVRLGWGAAVGLTVSVASEPAPPAPAPASTLPRIICAPLGAPRPEVPPIPLPVALRQILTTPWGDSLELGRERGTPETTPNPGFNAPAPVVVPPPVPGRRARPKPADQRTHTLLFRTPLAPFAAPTRLDVVAPGFTAQRRSQITPLLGAAGEIALLFGGETTELLIAGNRAVAAPAFEPRRYAGYGDGPGAAGLALGAGRSLLLGESRRRLTLEDHHDPAPPPLFLGSDREAARRRPMTLGRRDDGATGVLIFDGAAPEMVGVAPVDPAGAGVLALVKLAPWSTLTAASDARCKAPDPTAYRALVVLDPSTWLSLDPGALPDVVLAKRALAEVRWGRERVCLAALDAGVADARRRGDGARTTRLVARWDGKGSTTGAADLAPNGALRAADLRQDLRCVIAPPGAER